MRRCAGRIGSMAAGCLAICLVTCLATFTGAGAQPGEGNPALTDQQLTGMRLFNQSCRVCHTKPQMVSPLYGPELSQSSAGGQAGSDA